MITNNKIVDATSAFWRPNEVERAYLDYAIAEIYKKFRHGQTIIVGPGDSNRWSFEFSDSRKIGRLLLGPEASVSILPAGGQLGKTATIPVPLLRFAEWKALRAPQKATPTPKLATPPSEPEPPDNEPPPSGVPTRPSVSEPEDSRNAAELEAGERYGVGFAEAVPAEQGPWDGAEIKKMLGFRPKAKPAKAKPTPKVEPMPAAAPDASEAQVDEAQAEQAPDMPEIDYDPSDEKAKERAKQQRNDALRQLNKDHCVVNENGKVLVFKEVQDRERNRPVWQRMLFADFQRAYMNQYVMVDPKGGGTPKAKTYADYWLTNPARREYLNGVVFDPSHVGTNKPDTLNLWQGFAVQPKRGSWEKLKRHIETIVCNRDQSHFDYLMGWMARLIQYPHKQGEVAVVLRGDLGTGKGTLGHALLSLVGRHGMHISSSRHLTGNFNGHLRDCVYLFSDEAFYAGDKAGISTLKALITERWVTIEEKFMPAVQASNRLHIFMSSNSDWVVPAAQGERRFFVLDVSSDRKNDHDYFGAIDKELDNGGRAAMLYDLQNYDITDFNVRRVPETAALQDQKKLSLENHFLWWRDVLIRGYVHKSRLGLDDYFGRWHEFVTTDLLFDSYSEFAKGRGDRHPLDRERFGEFLGKMGGKKCRPQTGLIGEHVIAGRAEPTYKHRPPGYEFGTLGDARDAFETAAKLRVNWPGEESVDAH
jgi:hypothetical protein